MSTSSISPVSSYSGLICLYLDEKLSFGSVKLAYNGWMSPPSFKLDTMSVPNFSKKTWNCSFLSDFSDLRARI